MHIHHFKNLFFFSLFLLFLNQVVIAQNLIPDGGFEQITYSDCERPDQGFKKMQFWYLLDATPDLFEGACPFDEREFFFWDEDITPFEGRNYAGLWSRWNSNNNYVSEGIATALSAPLKAGQTYLFEMAIRNQGEFAGVLAGNQSPCNLTPRKHIDLYLSTDSIIIENDFSTGSSSTSAQIISVLESNDISGGSGDAWTLISTCFKAEGGEQFFGIIMPLGTFGSLPPCATDEVSEGVYQSFYYNLDAVSIQEFEESGERNLEVCSNQNIDINLLELFDQPLFKEASFIWDDGERTPFRQLSEKRTYEIVAEINCGTFPLTLNIQSELCESSFYVPNAFSPNGDGINDIFQVYYSEEINIENFHISIFNKWGNLVFQSQDLNFNWDAKQGLQYLQNGTYLWQIQFDRLELGESIKEIMGGEILLLR